MDLIVLDVQGHVVPGQHGIRPTPVWETCRQHLDA